MGQELFHGLKVSDAVGEIGTNGAALMVIQTLPLPKLAVFVFLVLIFFNLATSATGNGIALSLYTSKGIAREDEADPRFKAFWCMLFLVLHVGILLLERAIPGLTKSSGAFRSTAPPVGRKPWPRPVKTVEKGGRHDQPIV